MYHKIIRCLFSLFIISPTLNPYVNGITIYLWLFLVFFDFKFLSKLKFLNIKYLICFFLWLIICLINLDIPLLIKVISLFIGVTYLTIMKKEVMPKVYFFFKLSCVLCIAQFIAFYNDPAIAYLMGPVNIAKTVWAEYATPAFTNQYTIFLIPRFSGFSREAGFFASLIAIMFIIRLSDAKDKIRKTEYALFSLSFLFSLSKASLQPVIFFALFQVRQFIKKIPIAITLIAIISAMSVISAFLNVGSPDFFYGNESIAHRLASSFSIVNMDFGNMLYGCDSNYKCFTDPETLKLINYLTDKGLEPLTGINGVVLKFGALGLLLIFFTALLLNLDSFDLIILTVMTLTVTLFTLDSFVILTYFYLLNNKKNESLL